VADISACQTAMAYVSGCWTLKCQILCLLHMASLLQRRVPFSDVTERLTCNLFEFFSRMCCQCIMQKLQKLGTLITIKVYFLHILTPVIP
jgi:hypothetical protein